MTDADRQLMRRIADKLEVIPKMPADATAAAFCRQAAHTRGWFTAKEFAAVVGRNEDFITARCKRKAIKTLPGGKPYRIPLSEETDWNLI
ncbi:hypothetical protein [Geminisphaera colitermitum]|uniref:hypothetical protein n=1 Tax=Geminisphaera colitermitum TaxID=1148786 RepID=UPI000158D4AC|nr:hypothetical protein [Geminisphaera colitermitum]